MALTGLDTAIAQAVCHARLLELAYHSAPGACWEMAWADQVVGVGRLMDEHSVTFVAEFKPTDEPESLLTLRLDGHDRAVRIVPELLEIRRDKPIEILWRLGVESLVTVGE